MLNNNKRLVIVLEEEGEDKEEPLRVALVIVGGVGVNTITYDDQMIGQRIDKRQEIAAFRAGGRYVIYRLLTETNHCNLLLAHSCDVLISCCSAFALFTSKPMNLVQPLRKAAKDSIHVEAIVGETLAI